ncbi:MAG: hypothetical protein ACKO2K_16695, partial [Alphaproteobacteria bacterium]
ARPGHGREAVDVAGAWIDANAAPGAPIVVTSEEMATLARFHWPSRPVVPHPPFGVVADEANATPLADELPFPAGERVLFVFGRDWLTDPAGALRAELARRWRSCGGAEFEGIRVLCLERASADPAVANPPSPG